MFRTNSSSSAAAVARTETVGKPAAKQHAEDLPINEVQRVGERKHHQRVAP